MTPTIPLPAPPSPDTWQRAVKSEAHAQRGADDAPLRRLLAGAPPRELGVVTARVARFSEQLYGALAAHVEAVLRAEGARHVRWLGPGRAQVGWMIGGERCTVALPLLGLAGALRYRDVDTPDAGLTRGWIHALHVLLTPPGTPEPSHAELDTLAVQVIALELPAVRLHALQAIVVSEHPLRPDHPEYVRVAAEELSRRVGAAVVGRVGDGPFTGAAPGGRGGHLA